MEKIAKIRKIIRISKKKAIIFIITIIILGLIIFKNTKNVPIYTDLNQIGATTSSIGTMTEKLIYPEYYRYQNPTPSAEDNREFLKTNYNAEIQTRDVNEILHEIKNAVMDANGRIDNINENPKNGYVSFVVPKNNFENFKNDIENVTHKKMIVENISSENLLSQKQSIEQQQNLADNSLKELEQQKKNLLTQHSQTKNKLEKEIAVLENTLYALDPGPMGFSQSDIIYRQNLSNQITELKQQISFENSTYNANNQNLNNKIKTANIQISNINQQNISFINNIETVNGYISVRWISLWELAKIFSPIPPMIIITILILVILYFLNKKSYLPKIEFA